MNDKQQKNDGPAVQHLYEYYEPNRTMKEYVDEFNVTPENINESAKAAATFWGDEELLSYEDAYAAYSAAFEEYFNKREKQILNQPKLGEKNKKEGVKNGKQ